MHAQLKIGKQTILVCDNIGYEIESGNNLQLVIQFDTDEEVKVAYNVLLDVATKLNPPHYAGYSSCVAYLTDKFGMPWQLMVCMDIDLFN